MPDTTVPLIPSNGGSVGKQATLAQHLDAAFSVTAGRALVRLAGGWGAGWCVRVDKVALKGVSSTSGGGIASWVPPEGAPAVILRADVYVATGSTGAANASVGVAANATTSSTNLITATSVHTSSTLLDSLTSQAAASGAQAVLLTGTEALTVTGSADTTGFVGVLMIQYLLPTM